MNKNIGFLGLGNMGLNMVYHLLDQGYEVYAWNRGEEPRAMAAKAGAKVFASIPELIANLPDSPKVIFSMVSAGEPVDQIIKACTESADAKQRLNKGDIFIDGVNSFYKDTLRRGDELEKIGIHMIDCGVSGGIVGARNGACVMAGGEPEAYKHIENLIADIAQKDGYGYFGKRGSGHFVKMVHNAIEYGTMQAMAEGINLIDSSEFKVDFAKLTDVWNHGSIIEGNLMGFLNDAFKKDGSLGNIQPEVGSLGTGRWAVEDALQRGVPFNAIAAAVFSRYTSSGISAMAYKVVQAMREEFGGHSSADRPHN